MRVALPASLLLLGCVPLFAQAPASAAAPAITPAPAAAPAAAQPAEVDDSNAGFSYSLPADWELAAPPRTAKVTVPYPELVVKKGDACVDVAMTATHGKPASVVVVTALPYNCYGQTMKASDLANFGAGAADGLKQTFALSGPVEGNYMLGSHTVWIERGKGTPKGHPNDHYIFETACTLLSKGAVCWMAMASDWGSLRAFERAPVTLDGDSFTALVPRHAFIRNP